MKNKLLKLSTNVLLVLSLIVTNSVKASAESNFQKKRLFGQTRYDTSSAISASGWTNSYYAVIATGETFPDALAAAPLAKKYDAPILLTNYNELSKSISNELERLKVKHAFIIGGDGVISNSVENQIKSKGIETERISGANRYETAIKIAEKVGTSDEIVITTGEDFTDALSISSIAAKKMMPIILTEKNTMPDVVKNYISDNKISNAYILGGNDIISDSIADEFPNVERIQGSDKYERNINIISRFAQDLDFSNTLIATGEDFSDALSGSALASKESAPIILTNNAPSFDTKSFISSNASNIKQLEILGGAGVLSDSVINNLMSQATSADNQEHQGIVGTAAAEGNYIEELKNLAKEKVNTRVTPGELLITYTDTTCAGSIGTNYEANLFDKKTINSMINNHTAYVSTDIEGKNKLKDVPIEIKQNSNGSVDITINKDMSFIFAKNERYYFFASSTFYIKGTSVKWHDSFEFR
jgi:putative cell wall-binding protein